MMNADERNRFYELLIKAYEGSINRDEAIILNDLIKSDDETARLYVEFFDTVSSLVDINDKVPATEENDLSRYDDWLSSLAKAENEAPAVEVAIQEDEPRILIQKVQRQKIEYKLPKASILTLAASAAAVILIYAMMYFLPPARGSKVAVITDEIDAKWAGKKSSLRKGANIYSGQDEMILKEGYVKLLFDNQAQIILEAPAEFKIISEDRIDLEQGKLYATVPIEAIGFTVSTQCTKVIDLGTEFGIAVDEIGDASLHVIKGKTRMIAGTRSMEVSQGYAKKVIAATSMISDIQCDSQLFVRSIDSRIQLIWKGQKEISLADMVGAGNKPGTVENFKGIDPATGMAAGPLFQDRFGANQYHLVPSSDYIDGVFIPNGQTQQIVSSQGHLFAECPITGGIYFNNIINLKKLLPLHSNSESGDYSEVPCLAMHANAGITYDLQAIRSGFPFADVVRFRSGFGIEEEAPRPDYTNADFWVLVDGQIRFKKTQVKAGFFSIDIPLSGKDRFLTLITTDGGDPQGRVADSVMLATIDSDWCVFTDPVLIAE